MTCQTADLKTSTVKLLLTFLEVQNEATTARAKYLMISLDMTAFFETLAISRIFAEPSSQHKALVDAHDRQCTKFLVSERPKKPLEVEVDGKKISPEELQRREQKMLEEEEKARKMAPEDVMKEYHEVCCRPQSHKFIHCNNTFMR